MKFRKKPVVIDAQQWWPPGDSRHDPSMLSPRKENTIESGGYNQTGDLFQFSKVPGMGDDLFFVVTLEGYMRVDPGDWIITGGQGEKYPCKPDIFEATYEPVVEES